MTSYRQDKSWTERSGYNAQDAAATDDIDCALKKQGFQRPHTAMGGMLGIVGHWVGLAGAMSPIVIGEFIADPAKRWRATRLAAVGTAVAYEALYTARELQRQKEQNARLADCETRARQPG
jgi:hypothetical protein